MSRYLVLAMHDVTPATWPACKVLLNALDEVCPVPKSLLVIPNFYRGPTARNSEGLVPPTECPCQYTYALA